MSGEGGLWSCATCGSTPADRAAHDDRIRAEGAAEAREQFRKHVLLNDEALNALHEAAKVPTHIRRALMDHFGFPAFDIDLVEMVKRGGLGPIFPPDRPATYPRYAYRAVLTPAPHDTTEEDYGDGCDCTELCAMGPTCPGGMLAGLSGSGCWRTPAPAPDDAEGEG